MVKKKPFAKLKFLIASLFLVTLFYFVIFRLNLFSINRVEVVLDSMTCADEGGLKKESGLVGKSIFLIDEKNVEKKLQNKYPCIKSIRAENRFVRAVLLKVSGRTPLARVMTLPKSAPLILDNLQATEASTAALLDWSFPESSQESSLVVDGEGFIFDEGNRSYLPPLFIEGENLKSGVKLNNFSFEKISAVFQRLKQLEVPIFQAKILGDSLLVHGPQKVVFSFGKDIFGQLASLQLILQKAKIDEREMELIDLRFNKPILVYTPKK